MVKGYNVKDMVFLSTFSGSIFLFELLLGFAPAILDNIFSRWTSVGLFLTLVLAIAATVVGWWLPGHIGEIE